MSPYCFPSIPFHSPSPPNQSTCTHLDLGLSNVLHTGGRAQSLLGHDLVPTGNKHQRLQTKHNSQSDHGANDAVDGGTQSIALLGSSGGRSSAVGAAGRGDVRGTGTGGVLANAAPFLGGADGEGVHLGGKLVPGDQLGVAAEERVDLGLGLGAGGSVVEEEADADVVCRGERGRGDGGVCDELKGHGGRVVDDAVEGGVRGGEVGQAEEGEEGGVGAELDVHLALSGSGDCGVEALEDLGGEGHAGNGAQVVAAVVGQAKLVGVGEGAELEQSFV